MSIKQVYKGKLYSQTVVKNNILRIWEKATPEERTDWYQEANDWATELSKESGLSVLKICGVIASLSPVKSWKLNLVCARDMVLTGDCGHIKVFKKKAEDIIQSADNENQVLDILKGNKISSFFLNIYKPAEESEVTIDRHALSVALGVWINEEDYTGMTDTQYLFFVNCFKLAAKKANVPPLLMQSATWVRWRKIKSDYKRGLN